MSRDISKRLRSQARRDKAIRLAFETAAYAPQERATLAESAAKHRDSARSSRRS